MLYDPASLVTHINAIIQTDEPAALLEYLTQTGRHAPASPASQPTLGDR